MHMHWFSCEKMLDLVIWPDVFTREVVQSFEFTYICNNNKFFVLLTWQINILFCLHTASVAEGDQEEQLEAPTKKQKISKKVQTRVSPRLKLIKKISPKSTNLSYSWNVTKKTFPSQSWNISRLK